MIRTLKVLFCDNEHGCGDVTFPDLSCEVDPQTVIKAPTFRALRKQAHEAGWRYWKGLDYCAECVEFEGEAKA